jgi:DNA polymerase-3 subunit gamma/tau
MIFSGIRGVGKTTLARIMAKALNCEQGGAPEPCNTCTSCVEINSGSSVDLTEIDGASNRGIQEIRELKENIRFMPTGSRYKIIIIDEVHMLTAEAFNALLKTLEEPPEHVYFMFATTELHKIPVTILSRCQRYELQRISTSELAGYFQSIAEKEGATIEPAALNIIVREAGGSVRDGLSLLDQIFSYCGKTVRADDVVNVLGLVVTQVVSELSSALLEGRMATVLEVVDRLYGYGMDLKRFINDLLAWFRALVICSVTSRPEKLLDFPDSEMSALRECAERYPSQGLVLMFNVLVENLEKTGYSSRPRYALEMALVKAVQAREVVPVSRLLGRLDEILDGDIAPDPEEDASGAAFGGTSAGAPSGKKTSLDGTGREESASKPDQEEKVTSSEEKEIPASGLESGDAATTGPAMEESAGPAHNPADREQAEKPSEEKKINRTVRRDWNDFIKYVMERKPWMASALQMAAVVRLEGEELVIEYEDALHCRMLKNRENITPLTEFALDFFQQEFRISFFVPDSNGCKVDPSPGDKVKQERQALANDTLVLTAIDVFNGEVGDIRVGPRFRKPMDKTVHTDAGKTT